MAGLQTSPRFPRVSLPPNYWYSYRSKCSYRFPNIPMAAQVEFPSHQATQQSYNWQHIPMFGVDIGITFIWYCLVLPLLPFYNTAGSKINMCTMACPAQSALVASFGGLAIMPVFFALFGDTSSSLVASFAFFWDWQSTRGASSSVASPVFFFARMLSAYRMGTMWAHVHAQQ